MFLALRCIGLVALALAWGPAVGADLALGVAPTEVSVTPLREQFATFTARNLGPEAVAIASVVSAGSISATQLTVRVVGDCPAVVSTTLGATTVAWPVGSLAPGQSASCTFGFRALVSTTSPLTLVGLRVSAVGNSDPSTTNNLAVLVVTQSATDRPVDLAITLVSPAQLVILPGGSAVVRFRLENLGPSTPDFVSAINRGYGLVPAPDLTFPGFDLFPSPTEPPCGFFKDQEGPSVFFVSIGPANVMGPGSSYFCQVRVDALPRASGFGILTLDASGTGAGVYDTNASNNAISVSIFYSASAPVGRADLVVPLLVILLGLIGTSRARRRYSRRTS